MDKINRSADLFERAQKVIPGGVNSPVRAFGSVDETPRFMERADGTYMTDADGNSYLDYIGSWGPMILGHAHPQIIQAITEACQKGTSFGTATEAEVNMAEFICGHIPSIEMIRMVNSGTEAVMSAIRTARGFTGRKKIIKLDGCYHGHSDGLLVQAGSGLMTAGLPASAGVPAGCVEDTLTAQFNHLDSIEGLFRQYPDEIACLIVEPVAANMGVVLPEPGFLEGLRQLCTDFGALLIFDEVITGFRLGFGGAQEYFHVTPDLTAYGKIIGAGMPVGAFGGRHDVMQCVAPAGAVYQAGTLSGNPLAMTAGLTQLSILAEHPNLYHELEEKGQQLFGGFQEMISRRKVPCTCNYIGSLGCVFFTSRQVKDDASAKASDIKLFAAYFRHMLRHGIYIGPSQFEAMFLSAAHTTQDIQRTLEAADDFFAMG